MTKQQIVVQLLAAKIASCDHMYDSDLAKYGNLADKIIEMFPEHDYSVTNNTHSYFPGVIDDLENPNSALSKALARNLNVQRAG